VEGQPFFTTVAGLAISLAGFGAVIAWLRDDPSGWDPINLWRLRTIVRHALTISFICLGLVPFHTLTGDDRLTLRFGSTLVLAMAASDLWRVRNRDPEVWMPPSSWITFIALNSAIGLLAIGNLAWKSLGLLQALVLFILSSPAGIFSNFVREVGRPGEADQS
jgi:hypothetical protein